MENSEPELTIRKFEGRLRSICRGSPKVNTARAEYAGNVRVASLKTLQAYSSSSKVSRIERSIAFSEMPDSALDGLEKDLNAQDSATDEIEVQAFGYLTDDNANLRHKSITSRRGRIVTLRGTPSELSDVSKHDEIIRLQVASTLKFPNATRIGFSSKPSSRATSFHPLTGRRTGGAKTLVGIIDVGGFDFSHEDFLNPDGSSRFVAIWDQGGETFPSPSGFKYGSLLTAHHIREAIKAENEHNLPATEIMRQSQMERGSHATHVASIAAGNHSLAPDALIAGVLISIPAKEQDSRMSFYDTTRIVHAVEYLLELADDLRNAGAEIDGVSINISLGTNGGPHDNSSPMTRWIDNALTKPGVCVSVAAGNAGQEAPQNAQDIGYMLGRIHTQGHIRATGLADEHDWVIVGDGINDVSENELEIWYAPQDRIAVQVRPPDGEWMKVVEPGQYMQNVQIDDMTYLSIYNEVYDAGNGCNRIGIYLSPNFSSDKIIGLKSGVWQIRLIGSEIRDGRYHGWIERDDPVHLEDVDGDSFWQFPSFFGEASFVDASSISTLACGDRIIAVANQDEARRIMNVTSSQGPTRDGRQKPDIAAAGTDITAANGFDPQSSWVGMTGTSMASPLVAGLAAAMISKAPSLTSSQIMGIIRRTATPFPRRPYEWQNDCGFGALNIEACLAEADNVGDMKEV